MDLETVLIILSVVILVLAVVIVMLECRVKPLDKISFKESLDLANLPIITFNVGESKLNFLLDTGSNDNHILPAIADKLSVKKEAIQMEIMGITGIILTDTYICTMDLMYRNKKFTDKFHYAESLEESFKQLKKETGVTCHGILGNAFFQKYKYIIDFDELVAYAKK